MSPPYGVPSAICRVWLRLMGSGARLRRSGGLETAAGTARSPPSRTAPRPLASVAEPGEPGGPRSAPQVEPRRGLPAAEPLQRDQRGAAGRLVAGAVAAD